MKETWNVNGVGLDWKARDILQAIDHNNGEANTTEIKNWTGIDHNQIIHHRYDQLEEAGLVTTREGSTTDNRTPPTVASLTDAGEEFVENEDYEVVDDDDAMTLNDRVTRLEQQMDKVRDDMWQVKSDIRGLRDDFEQLLEQLHADSQGTDHDVDRRESGMYDGVQPTEELDADELDFGND